jgi:hypothetical protein
MDDASDHIEMGSDEVLAPDRLEPGLSQAYGDYDRCINDQHLAPDAG